MPRVHQGPVRSWFGVAAPPHAKPPLPQPAARAAGGATYCGSRGSATQACACSARGIANLRRSRSKLRWSLPSGLRVKNKIKATSNCRTAHTLGRREPRHRDPTVGGGIEPLGVTPEDARRLVPRRDDGDDSRVAKRRDRDPDSSDTRHHYEARSRSGHEARSRSRSGSVIPRP